MKLSAIKLAANVMAASVLSFAVFTGAARADEEGGSAPTNVPTAPGPVGASSGDAEGGYSVPLSEPTFQAETRRVKYPNVPLLATGATVFAASYVPAVIGGAVSDRGDDDLYIPLAGPWMTLSRGPDEGRSHQALLVVDGVAQGLGALMMVSSLFIPQKVTRSWYLIGSHQVHVSPTHIARGVGLSATGRF